MIEVAACGAEAAAVVHALMQAAFAEYGVLDPPSGALAETVESIAADLAEHGGMVAREGGEPVACLRFERRDGHLHARRVSVRPDRQGAGIGRVLMAAAEEHARRVGEKELWLGVRTALPDNLAFYRRLGYEPVVDHGFWIELSKVL